MSMHTMDNWKTDRNNIIASFKELCCISLFCGPKHLLIFIIIYLQFQGLEALSDFLHVFSYSLFILRLNIFITDQFIGVFKRLLEFRH